LRVVADRRGIVLLNWADAEIRVAVRCGELPILLGVMWPKCGQRIDANASPILLHRSRQVGAGQCGSPVGRGAPQGARVDT
jgi:hypothetical protein